VTSVAQSSAATPAVGWRGRYFEDFVVGDVYQHPLGRTRLKPIPTRALTATHITNKSARAVSRSTDVLDDLAQSASHTVQWADAMSLLGELRVTVAIETGPGDILTGLVQRNTPAIRAASVATTRFSDVTYLMRRGASDAATDGRWGLWI
jgi:malonyl CoA-acyl carrier protein transacylase